MNKLIDFQSLQELFRKGEIEITETMYQKLNKYAELLCEWNEKINLTAITAPEEIAVKHYFDSIYPFVLKEPKKNAKLIDVGTGAGFPAVPLKIFREDIDITLLDSLNKRVIFLNEVSEKLQLNAKCIHGRAEEIAGNKELYREKYDIATARAVADLSVLSEYCLPFVKIGGEFYVLKGKNIDDEVKKSSNALKVLGGEIEFQKKYCLPNGDERNLILIRKQRPTPEKYPRNSGQIKKNPL